MLDEEYSLHNLERGGVDLNLQGVNKPKTNLLERQSKRETWCQCAAALNPGLPSKSCLKETKALQRAKPNTFQIHWTIHFEERIPKNLETLLVYTEKLLRVIKIILLPVREGDSVKLLNEMGI